jgi:hypothetical protein
MHAYLFGVDEKKRKCFVCEERKKQEEKKRKGKNLLLSFSHYVLIASCLQNIPAQQSFAKDRNEVEFNSWLKITACSIPR